MGPYSENCREIYMDNAKFCYMGALPRYFFDLDDPNSAYSAIFRYFNFGVERFSMRNAQWYNSNSPTGLSHGCTDIPQNALIKFVRNAPPSLRWFRSDLTKENIAKLQKQFPQIELVN